jgi:hypothetical protein
MMTHVAGVRPFSQLAVEQKPSTGSHEVQTITHTQGNPTPAGTSPAHGHLGPTTVHNTTFTLNMNIQHSRPTRCGDAYHGPRYPGEGPGRPLNLCHTEPPRPSDSCHPAGSLKTDEKGVVTTPGGYKIEALGQYEWKVTGPDGKSTRVWGDPHVAEGDGGKWDFKRNSTFMLGDGTRINVTTAPVKNGMTVTKDLEIISGNEAVSITGLDKGKGKTGPVTQDGFSKANSFGGNDVFVMGKETDDWSFQGKEIIGSNNGGESFKLGNALPVGGPEPMPGTQPSGGPQQLLRQILQMLMSLCESMSQNSGAMQQSHLGGNQLTAPGTQGPWMQRRQEHLASGFKDMSRMFDVFMRLGELSRSLQSFRNGSIPG